ncbi:phytoene desaturase family protein [Streptomyces sp. TR06-5]|uniref:phytoene desaturase family protein n=1 Tax=Streptomyces sp. TR06-5 TaxID=3385976 RepID=UPI00399FBB16
MPEQPSYDAVIVGGGHNGLVAAAYLARAGLSVALLERADHTGGAAVSTTPFTGVDARLSAYSYLVSLLPRRIATDLGVAIPLRKRAVSSYTPFSGPAAPSGLLVTDDDSSTRESFRRLTGSDREFEEWQRFYAMTGRVAERVFPTLTDPLPTRDELRTAVGEDAAWEELFERPLGEAVEARFSDDLVRGVVLTDALIGTFSEAHDPSLLQNRCFLYHIIGGGTGDWDVPVGGMGAVSGALASAARSAGAELVTGCHVHTVETDGAAAAVHYRTAEGEGTVEARHVLSGASAQAFAEMLGEVGPPRASGSQLKVNMLLRRLPRLRDTSVDPREAFAGTFHIAEGYGALAEAYRQASGGRMPSAPPSEIYCHSLTDPSILGPDLVREGYQTLTLFGLLMPEDLFTGDNDARREEALKATIAQLDAHLEEPLADCLAVDADGRPCIEAKTPVDLEGDLRLPGGHIFHGDLSFPYRQPDGGRWGVETQHPNVWLCGASAVRGGGVSGVAGHNAAMAVLEAERAGPRAGTRG